MPPTFTARRDGQLTFNAKIFLASGAPFAELYLRQVREEGAITLYADGLGAEMKVVRNSRLKSGEFFLLRPGAKEKVEAGAVVASARKKSALRRRFVVTEKGDGGRTVVLAPTRRGGHTWAVVAAGKEGDAGEVEDGKESVGSVKKSGTGAVEKDEADADEEADRTEAAGAALATLERQGHFSKRMLEYKIVNVGNLSNSLIAFCYFLVNLMNKRDTQGEAGGSHFSFSFMRRFPVLCHSFLCASGHALWVSWDRLCGKIYF